MGCRTGLRGFWGSITVLGRVVVPPDTDLRVIYSGTGKKAIT